MHQSEAQEWSLLYTLTAIFEKCSQSRDSIMCDDCDVIGLLELELTDAS